MGVAQVLDAPHYPASIMLADAGQASLAQMVKPLALDELIGLAAGMAKAVAGMHGRGVLHRDICPANIVISSDGAPCLVGFGLATLLAEIRPEFTHHSQIVGTLAYLAPEQTGVPGGRWISAPICMRWARRCTSWPPVSRRSARSDPLRLTHDHLARVPAPPGEINPAVPEMLSAIIMHLLDKEPDDRYQSADGVVYDLQQLRAPAVSTAATQRVGGRDFPAAAAATLAADRAR